MVEVLKTRPVVLNKLACRINMDLKGHALLAFVDHKVVPAQRRAVRAIEKWQLNEFLTDGTDNSACTDVGSGDRAGGNRATLDATDSTAGGVMAEAAFGRKRDRPSTVDSDSDPHSSTPPGEWHVEVWTTAAAEQQEGGEAEEAAAVAAGRRAAVGVHVELAALSRPDLTAAFWRLAEAMRNDVVRDTRRWRRAAARGGAGAGTAS